jgi:lipopolysaccharide export LptBFGC system permease protein LptF
MSKLTTRQLLVRHAVPFTVSFVSLTLLLHAQRWGPLRARGAAEGGTVVEVLVLALPSTLALTLPMAVFLAVSWVFTRLGAEGAFATARRKRGGVRRLMTPVMGAAAVIAMFALISNTEVLPRTNARLVAVLAGAPREPTDRTMTVGELRAASQRARPTNAARAAAYEVEIQKKFAISAGCVILALVAVALALRFPRGGAKLVLTGSSLVFIAYWLLLIAGEGLADRQLVSPLVGMWMADALLLGLAFLLMARPSRPAPTHGAETLAIDG